MDAEERKAELMKDNKLGDEDVTTLIEYMRKFDFIVEE